MQPLVPWNYDGEHDAEPCNEEEGRLDREPHPFACFNAGVTDQLCPPYADFLAGGPRPPQERPP